jgi:hypothetical protein
MTYSLINPKRPGPLFICISYIELKLRSVDRRATVPNLKIVVP